ncbi:cation/H(+) antiporter 15-like [Vicia villosa]|uniref:cation/H(+) antiporter 15-like n=1 Tax=Vicia villosa TaxID=3911 RepID=UPI00273BBFD9|nr:cation/H(+) antiporter 15-like [Vicia villosa]
MNFESGTYKFLCQNPRNYDNYDIWHSANPLHNPRSLFLLQYSLLSIVSQFIFLCIQPLGQSSIVAQILTGVLLGPSFLGHKKLLISNALFPPKGSMVIETTAAFGAMFFFFIIGVRMDPAILWKTEKKAMIMSASVFLFTLIIPSSLSYLLTHTVAMDKSLSKSLPFIALSQSFTAFTAITIVLNELKILNTDIGRLAMSISMFADIIGFSLAVIFFSVIQNKTGSFVNYIRIFSSLAALVLSIIFVMRPMLIAVSKKLKSEKHVSEWFFVCIMIFVLIAGFLSESIGQHYVMGPLLLGIALPEGPPIGTSLIAKIEAFTYAFFYPIYLTISGMKTNIFKIDYKSMWIVCFLVVFSVAVKIGAVMFSGYYTKVPMKECFVIGLILNTRGAAELLVYNLWRGSKLISEQEFSLVVFSVIAVNAIIIPLIKILYDPSKQYHPIIRSSIQHTTGDLDVLRIMVCVYRNENIPTMMNLLEVSHASEESNVRVIALILVELLGTSRPLLVAHQPHDILRCTSSKSTQVNHAFYQYIEHNKGYATVELFTSVSNLETTNDDVCRIAIDRIANILILPFHKQWEIDGSVEVTNKSIQYMNIKVLNTAPCSVGILVDRSANHAKQLFSNPTAPLTYQVGVFFIGGPDDIEALAYSSRMCRHENVKVTVVRFLEYGLENSIEKRREGDMIGEYRNLNRGNRRFKTVDEVIKDGIEMSKRIKKRIDSFDLVMVGKEHAESALLQGYEEWSECPELGVIGDMLSSPDFETKTSILIVQQQRIIRRKLSKMTHEKEKDYLLHSHAFDMQIRIDEKK